VADAGTDRHGLSDSCWGVVNRLLAAMDTPQADGQPDTLYGPLSQKLHGEGTVRSNGQFAAVEWLMADSIWCPAVVLFQHDRHAGVDDQMALLLGPPPVIKEGRKAMACRWYGRQENEEFARLMARKADPQTVLKEKMQAWREAA
jgi:hypothetical protein